MGNIPGSNPCGGGFGVFRLAVFVLVMRALAAGPKQAPKQPATPTKQPPFRRPGDNGP